MMRCWVWLSVGLNVGVGGWVGCGGENKDDNSAATQSATEPAVARAIATAADPAAGSPTTQPWVITKKPTIERVKPQKPTAAQLKSLRFRMKEGRRLENAGDYAAAVQHFEAAVALPGGTERALSELGWAGFRAGDLEKAIKASKEGARLGRETQRVRSGCAELMLLLSEHHPQRIIKRAARG